MNNEKEEQQLNGNGKKRIPVWAYIPSFLFLIWFAVSFIVMVRYKSIFSPSMRTPALLLILGQFLSVFGVIALIIFIKSEEKKKSFPFLIFPVAGLAVVAAGVYKLAKVKGKDVSAVSDALDRSGDNKLIWAGLFLFITGAVILFFFTKYYLRIRQRCTEAVSAVCVGWSTMISSDESKSLMHGSVYEYFFNGKVYRASPKISDAKEHLVGREYKINVNPDNPQEIFDDSLRIFSLVVYAIAPVLVSAGLYCFFMHFFG